MRRLLIPGRRCVGDISRVTESWKRTVPSTAIVVVSAACLAAQVPAAIAQPDPFKNSPTGTLTLTIDVEGQGRHTAQNKVEWHELNVKRQLQLEFPMVRIGTAPVGFKTSPKAQAIEQAVATPPAGVAEMSKAMEACKGDQQCIMQTGMKFGRLMQQGKMEKLAGPSAGKMDRFHHWMTDRRRPCASGSIVIDDSGHGMVISPPKPAAPFNYRRTGERKLPAELELVIEQACAATLTIDTVDGSVDIGVSGPFVPVKVTYTGAFATETGRSVLFVEGAKNGVQVGAVDLFDFPVDLAAKSMTGQRQIEKMGQVTHAGGYGTTPVRATVKWSFVRH